MNLEQVLRERAAELAAQLADPWQWVALAAAIVAGVFIVASTLVKTIVPLRWLAVGGNVGFVVYGLVHPAPMVFVLHAVLLPINLWRVLEMQRLTRRVHRAATLGDEGLKVWLQPYMKRRRLKPGAVLFRQGEPADRLYVLVEGQLELVEAGRSIEAGQMFGEIAFFSPTQRRTATVRCLRAATLLSIDEVAFRQVFYQNPAFGFEVARLITERLGGDVQRLQAQRDATLAAPPADEAARVQS